MLKTLRYAFQFPVDAQGAVQGTLSLMTRLGTVYVPDPTMRHTISSTVDVDFHYSTITQIVDQIVEVANYSHTMLRTTPGKKELS